jgi:hypothetical protein
LALGLPGVVVALISQCQKAVIMAAMSTTQHGKFYRYVGPPEIAKRACAEAIGFPISSPDDVRIWLEQTGQRRIGDVLIATFVVDTNGVLRIADRRSEHIACAGGKPVLSAGEITFSVGKEVEVVEVSNQSTGYCPEPESWPSVATALARSGLNCLQNSSNACLFRRGDGCHSITLVKDSLFKCGMCGATLSPAYNVQ